MLRLRRIHLGSIAFVALALSACGGGKKDIDEPRQPTTFTVGGSVTGLSGSVVLRLNGGNDLTVNAPGSFTFATQLATGASYAVTLASQPSTQVCGPGVTNGTGAIGSANVTNVAVSCTNYSVGGTVTGLTGSGLVLQVNGANDMSVAAASSNFTFPASVSLGGLLYSVHIASQPAGQTCTIVDSSGVVTAGAPNALAAAIACIDNVTDPLSGTWRLRTRAGQPITDLRAFLSLHADGTYIFALHQDDLACGASGHGGLEYGVYRWNRTTHVFEFRTAVIDTNGECGIHDDSVLLGALAVNADGTLTFDDGEQISTLEAVPSNAGTLIGSWGDNQAFVAYDSNGKFLLATTRAILQNAASSPGIEDGCYSLTGTTASGTFTVDVSNACAVSASQTAVDTNGQVALSQLVGRTLDFSVTGDAMQTTAGGINALVFVPGTRITAAALPASIFSVSGAITGLTGTGLGLRLNGDSGPTFNVSPAAGASSFAFSAALHSGDAYRVTVAGEPGSPTQFCFLTAGGVGTIGASDVTDVAINCLNSAAYTTSGSASGLTAAGLSLQLRYFNLVTGAAGSADLPLAANGNFAFPNGAVAANNAFAVGIRTQPSGQTCMVSRARGFSLGATVATLGVTCVDNSTDPLSGTYSVLDAQGRGYVNFNADGTFTTALIHNSTDCDTTNDTRQGNGAEYGIFTWDDSTGAFNLPVAPAVDTNGSCGFANPGDLSAGFGGTISRVGSTIELREIAGGPVIVTASAVESNPGSLVGAFVPEGNNGTLLVFHSDGTFLFAETQLLGLFPLGYGQERGCYAASGSVVTMTLDASCRPDGFDAYDLNGNGGIFPSGVTSTLPLPFTFNDADTLVFLGNVFKRTQPN
jgi:large repetitive protein